MKTTFKKALAAVSASAVVATSAVAMFATPASAAGAVFSMGQVEISLADLQAANYQVAVNYSVSNNAGMGENAFGIYYGEDGLAFSKKKSGDIVAAANDINGVYQVANGSDTLWVAGSVSSKGGALIEGDGVI